MQKGIILCGHGTKNQQGLNSFFKVFRALGHKLPAEYKLSYGFVENIKPALLTAIDEFAQQGIYDIILAPILLFSGMHTLHDIPDVVEQAQNKHPGVTIHVAKTPGASDKIVELCLQLVEKELDKMDGTANNKQLLVVGAGSSKPLANIIVARLSRLLWENLPFQYASYAFVSKMTHPSVNEELTRLLLGGKNDIVVLPILLFPGVYLDKIALAVENFKHEQKAKIALCGAFEDNDLLVEAFAEQINETINNADKTKNFLT